LSFVNFQEKLTGTSFALCVCEDSFVRPAVCLALSALFASTPVYDDLSLSFEIPSKLTGAGMVRVSIRTVMPEGASKDDACERTALDALQLLQHDHDLNVLDCNWSEALEIRARCAILVDQFVEIRNIHGLVHSKCLMVTEGIGFASDVLLNKVMKSRTKL
jgi:hypothetical protein